MNRVLRGLTHLLAPTAMVEALTTCMAMGMLATRRTTHTLRHRRKLTPSLRRTTMMTETTTTARERRNMVILNMTFWKRDTFSTELTMAAALPKKVSEPVAVTWASIWGMKWGNGGGIGMWIGEGVIFFCFFSSQF